MKDKIFKMKKVDQNLIELYKKCFKNYLIYNERMKSAIKDETVIDKMFD